MLKIDRETFERLYPDLDYDWFFTKPKNKQELEQVYFKSKLWRLNNMYSIINKDGEPVVFNMNYAQHVTYAASRQHPRIIILKSRQQGISTLWLVSFFDDAIWAPYLNIGLMAQGTDEAAMLLERVKFMWEQLSDGVKNFLNIKLLKDNAKAFSFSNHSTMFIRVSFRSTALQRLHISEFGKIAHKDPKRAKETKTGTLQALGKGNTGAIESTAEGRNEFSFMWDAAIIAKMSNQLAEKDFYPVFLPWIEDPDCVSDVYQTTTAEAAKYFAKLEKNLKRTLTQPQKNFWIIQYRELGDDIYQEYPATPEEAFAASRDGTYYAKVFQANVIEFKRVVVDLYDPNLEVDVYCDIGVDDYFVMVFVQWYKGEYRIVGEYINNGYSTNFYIDHAEARGWRIGTYYFPHDMAVRELGEGNGLARSREDMALEYLKEIGSTAKLDVLEKTGVEHGIEAVRRIVPKLWIDTACEYLINCFNNYSKEWDDKLKQWKPKPLHNEYCHGADALRGMAQHLVEKQSMHESQMRVRKRRVRNTGHDV
ncbi:MAG: hypothetical protein HRU18_06670 [Pseudoalteromonas sp.]|uniref:hypothetical protein n=1 Tax=Pseudoalteromonas sp. TaxID=53249 RepID=UPI001D80B947|nr:hypothetical protein [Pseudoalteromonas sp.]NRA77873.1 hypothetical protein [Pseudoalteromonas sp.]